MRSEFSLLKSSVGKNVIISGVDLSSSMHIDNKKKYLLIIVKGLTQGLDDTTLTAEAQYSVNLSRSNRSLHYNRSNSFFSCNARKMYQLSNHKIQVKKYIKAKDSEIRKYHLCLGNNS